jgi:hypothetical protein|tara:strand:+ start:1452 stop:1808 length:357 start_codon:yes stop_codon:yes gene_type:complete
MPILQFTFTNQLNVSAQVGDTAYYVPTSTSAQFQVNSSDIVEIGDITYIDPDGLGFWCDTTLSPALYPSPSDYLFFSKDNRANQSSVLGYYAKVQLKNSSKDEAEIFGVSADTFESSK